jgi:HTH-type transcriptional regulator, cell division transcriptional repressor
MPNAKITKNILGHRMQKARKQAGIGQAELAAILEEDFGISMERSLVSRIERKERPVRDIELDAIAKALSVTPNYLLGWTE